MLSIQSFICKKLDDQGLLPEKWTDLALRPSHPSYYNRAYVGDEEFSGLSHTDHVNLLVPGSNTEPIFDMSEAVEISTVFPKITNECYLSVYFSSGYNCLHFNKGSSYVKSRTGSTLGSVKKETSASLNNKKAGAKLVFSPSTKRWTSYYFIGDGSWTKHYTFDAVSDGPCVIKVYTYGSTIDLTQTTIIRGDEVIFQRK